MISACRVCKGTLYSSDITQDGIRYTMRKCNGCPYWTCDLVGTPNTEQETTKVEARRAKFKKR